MVRLVLAAGLTLSTIVITGCGSSDFEGGTTGDDQNITTGIGCGTASDGSPAFCAAGERCISGIDPAASVCVPRENAMDLAPTGDICSGDASYDFGFKGLGLFAWEGRSIAVVAQQRNGPGVERETVVRLTGSVRSGDVDLACANALSKTVGEGRVAAYIDVDGDGKCTPGADVGIDHHYFGWIADVHVRAFDPAVTPAQPADPDAAALLMIADTPQQGASFCSLFP